MAFTEGQSAGTTNNTTAVTVVSTPSSGYRVVKCMNFYNKDTANATLTVEYYDGSTAYEICKITLSAGDVLILDEVYVVPSGGTAVIRCKSSGTVTTNQLPFVATYGDST